jgi:hypothetical protein
MFSHARSLGQKVANLRKKVLIVIVCRIIHFIMHKLIHAVGNYRVQMMMWQKMPILLTGAGKDMSPRLLFRKTYRMRKRGLMSKTRVGRVVQNELNYLGFVCK